MISVLILTFNEEDNIADCIASLPWRDDVHVLDSQSADRTVEIARSMGARTTLRNFDDYASQRNAGLALPFQHEWIVMLDADERMRPELAAEIDREVARAHDDVAMFRVRRHDMFMGRWLRRSSGYPTWFPRIFRRGRVVVERQINEVYTPIGRARQLQGHIDHYPFNKGMEWWFERHNRYSTAEAKLLLARPHGKAQRLYRDDPGDRRAILKALAYRMPFRPILAFFYLYIVRGGFLDGRAGRVFASMRLAYEIMIDAKVAMMQSQGAHFRE